MKKHFVTILICTVFTVINLSAHVGADAPRYNEAWIRALALDEAKAYIGDHVTRSLENGGNTKIQVTEDDGSLKVDTKLCISNGYDKAKTIEPLSENVGTGCN